MNGRLEFYPQHKPINRCFHFLDQKKNVTCLPKPRLCQTRRHKKLDNGIASKNGRCHWTFWGAFERLERGLLIGTHPNPVCAAFPEWLVICYWKQKDSHHFRTLVHSGIELLVFMYSLRRMHGRTKKTPEANGYKQNPICKHIGRSKHIRWKYKSSPAKRFWFYNANCTIIYDHHISPKIWKKVFQSCSSYGKKQPLGAV